MFVYKSEKGRIPIKVWMQKEDYYSEQKVIDQCENLAVLPFAYHHVALMPDGHLGYGMPIGGVIACDKAIIPNAIGKDIGCGVIAVQTDILAEEISLIQIKDVLNKVREIIPVGFKHQKDEQQWDGFDKAPDIPVIQQHLKSARKQLGTLGGGNHFIEIQTGSDGFIWLMLHSGSRNFGLQIAEEYNTQAVKNCERWHSDIPNKDLAFLPLDLKNAHEYIRAMRYALDFALANRNQMMAKFVETIQSVIKCDVKRKINIPHNYASLENHFNKNVWVHRKGAIMARLGQLGIIPGSMGTPSYIVEGLGNPESFMSCSHGAGRKMSRTDASRKLYVEDCNKAMGGIVYNGWGKNRKGEIDLSEAPGAYKDIELVIEAECDLVKPVIKLRPLGVVKG